jgi:Mycothiol maleylpyruvate isomerase N-terminal domain
MMSARDDLTTREAEAWAAFYRMIEAVPVERREEPVLSDGWSVKDVLWHIAFWWSDLPGALERIRTGAPEVEGEGTDERNASALAQGRTRTFAEVEGEVVRTREALLAAWASAPEGPKADEVFVWETIEHYEEHEPQLRAFLDAEG